jgi:trk system potassium uptake protein TrkA
VVIGLGRFGRSLALELTREGVEVLGVDSDPRVVRSLAGRLTHVVEADSTDLDAMRGLGIGEFDRAVVGVGTNLEASILSASVVLELEVRNVWAKAISQSHARILHQVGVHHVVRPEHEREGAEIIVSGPKDKVEQFSALGDEGGGPRTERRKPRPAW